MRVRHDWEKAEGFWRRLSGADEQVANGKRRCGLNSRRPAVGSKVSRRKGYPAATVGNRSGAGDQLAGRGIPLDHLLPLLRRADAASVLGLAERAAVVEDGEKRRCYSAAHTSLSALQAEYSALQLFRAQVSHGELGMMPPSPAITVSQSVEQWSDRQEVSGV